MREIKFRAWDKLCNKMLIDSVEWNVGLILANKDDYDLMQFTGLKDKNGKEIYEGDIVLVSEIKYIVTWQNSKCRFAFDDMYGNNHDMLNIIEEHKKYYEVIGNIYENPELLSNVKNMEGEKK